MNAQCQYQNSRDRMERKSLGNRAIAICSGEVVWRPSNFCRRVSPNGKWWFKRVRVPGRATLKCSPACPSTEPRCAASASAGDRRPAPTAPSDGRHRQKSRRPRHGRLRHRTGSRAHRGPGMLPHIVARAHRSNRKIRAIPEYSVLASFFAPTVKMSAFLETEAGFHVKCS
jgi:hypothetical protein